MAGQLAVRGLHKRFGGGQALAGVSRLVEAGDAATVIDPNGAGKSTLLKTIARSQRPDRGEIRLRGLRRRPEPCRPDPLGRRSNDPLGQ